MLLVAFRRLSYPIIQYSIHIIMLPVPFKTHIRIESCQFVVYDHYSFPECSVRAARFLIPMCRTVLITIVMDMCVLLPSQFFLLFVYSL